MYARARGQIDATKSSSSTDAADDNADNNRAVAYIHDAPPPKLHYYSAHATMEAQPALYTCLRGSRSLARRANKAVQFHVCV